MRAIGNENKEKKTKKYLLIILLLFVISCSKDYDKQNEDSYTYISSSVSVDTLENGTVVGITCTNEDNGKVCITMQIPNDKVKIMDNGSMIEIVCGYTIDGAVVCTNKTLPASCADWEQAKNGSH